MVYICEIQLCDKSYCVVIAELYFGYSATTLEKCLNFLGGHVSTEPNISEAIESFVHYSLYILALLGNRAVF